MIFNSNTTALSATTIPMAEGYDCSYGASLALVEAARNDFAMFQALVNADYKEMSICKESAGVVMEGEVAALQEAVGGGIFKKIAELFKKLVAKIKSIFHNLMAKLNGLFMKDKDLVKKYQGELARKRNLDKLEVKFRKPKDNFENSFADLATIATKFKEEEGWVENSWDRVKHYLGVDVDSVEEFVKEGIDAGFEDEDTVTLGSIGGWRALASDITSYGSDFKKMQSDFNKATNTLEKMVNDYDKKVNTAVKDSVADKENDEKAAAVTTATKAYDMAQAFQTAMLAVMQLCTKASTLHYKQSKAAFMKAVTANDKKLEENAIYLNAVAEAAEEEVDAVIEDELKSEELSDLSAAPTTVKDAGVKDDPDALTYGPDCYTDSVPMDTKDGELKNQYDNVEPKEESAFFGAMFY